MPLSFYFNDAEFIQNVFKHEIFLLKLKPLILFLKTMRGVFDEFMRRTMLQLKRWQYGETTEKSFDVHK